MIRRLISLLFFIPAAGLTLALFGLVYAGFAVRARRRRGIPAASRRGWP